jgi:chromatin remodeling complex protein RSC6
MATSNHRPEQDKADEGVSTEATSAFLAPLQPSRELAAVVGSARLPRPEVVSKIWEDIKKHKLLRSFRRCSAAGTRLSMFEMNKYLAQHLT